MSESRKDIIKKVLDLLKKTVENGCTEAEALAAAEKAQELTEKFAITPAELGLVKLTVTHWPEVNNSGNPAKTSQVNVVEAVKRLKITTRFDAFLQKYEIRSTNFVGALDDKFARRFIHLSFAKLDYAPNTEATREGLKAACEKNVTNSVQDYLIALKWDGERRVDTWLTTYFGAEDTPLHQAWGRLVLTAMCKRAYEPGCKFDHILVLEGAEGGNKSSACKVLANGSPPEASDMRYYSNSALLHKDEKQQMELCAGIWMYELAELGGLKRGDGDLIKNFVTSQADSARAAYGYFRTDQPRTPIFIGTFNPPIGSKDVGGEYLLLGDRRRWWPLPVGVIDIDKLYDDRDQLFAEIMYDCYWSKIEGVIPPEPGLGVPMMVPATQLLPPKGDCFGLLKLGSEHWQAAGVVQASREVPTPHADTLADLYSDLTTPVKYDANYQGNPTRLRIADGLDILPGRDFEITPTEVWVSSHLVKRMLGNADRSGREARPAMEKNGWMFARRGGESSRGYSHPRN